MLKIARILLFIWSGILIAANEDHHPKTRLFILSGQSNMARLDPKLSFTPTLKNAFPNDQIVIIKDAMGGQAIRRWYKKSVPERGESSASIGTLYDRLLLKVKAVVAKNHFDSVVFVWMQGERDAVEHHGDQYALQLRGLIDQLKQDIGRDDLYVVVGRLGDFGLKRPRIKSDWEKVRNAQMQVVDTIGHAAWVDTDDFNGENDALHYTHDGYINFGKKLAQTAISLLKQ